MLFENLVKPKFLIEPVDIQAKLNSIVYTKCEVASVPDAEIKWIRLSQKGKSNFNVN